MATVFSYLPKSETTSIVGCGHSIAKSNLERKLLELLTLDTNDIQLPPRVHQFEFMTINSNVIPKTPIFAETATLYNFLDSYSVSKPFRKEDKIILSLHEMIQIIVNYLKSDIDYTVESLWNTLSLSSVLTKKEYEELIHDLELRKRIIIEDNEPRYISWIWNPELVEELEKKNLFLVRNKK